MSVWVTGDLHGDQKKIERLCKFAYDKNLCETDVILVAGDAGLIFYPELHVHKKIYAREWEKEKLKSPVTDMTDEEFLMITYRDWHKRDETEKKNLSMLDKIKPKVMYVPGNHENYDRLKKLEKEKMFGDEVLRVSENVFVLQTGHVYVIENKTVFAYGGATSLDRYSLPRIEHFSWWKQEIPSKKILKETKETVRGRAFDLVLTHTAPKSLVRELVLPPDVRHKGFCNCEVQDVHLEQLRALFEYEKWCFGHFHVDQSIDDKHHCLFNNFAKMF